MPTDDDLRPLRSTYPPTSILNPAFVYVHSSKTDVRATIARARQQQVAARATTVRSFTRGRKR